MKQGTRRSGREVKCVCTSVLVIVSLLVPLNPPMGGKTAKAGDTSRATTSGPMPLPMITPLPTPIPVPTATPRIVDAISVPTPTPPPPGQPPGANLPNLDVIRTLQSNVPAVSPPVQPQLLGMRPICENGDFDCGGCPECEPPPPPPAPNDPNYGTPRTRPPNETGEPGITLASRNYNWSANLLSLPGRAGMDLQINLTYNSLVWTAESGRIKFNADRGFPGPGFRLGFPTVQDRFQNSDTGIWSYLLITPSGGRVELRQVGGSNVYEAYDGSYTQLIQTGADNVLVRTKDGTQMSFARVGAAFVCTRTEDRNGNFISATYDGVLPLTVTDTLGRLISFNYSNGMLMTITQDWNGQPHTWAEFRYADIPFSYNFPTMTADAAPSGSLVALPTQVWLDDGSRYEFTYNTWGQVHKISRFGSNGDELAYTRYNLPMDASAPEYDCPRFTQQYEWARDWNNGAEALTQLGIDSDGGQVMITPDGTRYKLLSYSSGWQRGLPLQSEVWSGGVRHKVMTFAWTQDDVNLPYALNPRVTETNVWDAAGNRKRQAINYGPYSGWSLPYETLDYAADGATPLRSTYTDYNLDPNYVNRRIIGLVSAVHIVDHALGGAYLAKTTYDYDWAGEYLVTTPQAATNHASNHTDPTGRGNLVRVARWDINDIYNAAKALSRTTGFNSTGSPVFTRDAGSHQVTTSYGDSNGGNTYAYPTAVTDADGFLTISHYDYRTGLLTQRQTPPPAGFAHGPIETRQYDDARRLIRVTNDVNGAYTRWSYPSSQVVQTFATIQNTLEAYSVEVLDGAGRVRAVAQDHPGSIGAYSGQYTTFDAMGRAVQQSNPTEMNSQWIPMGDDAVAGWVNASQAYDWQGRPTVTTNPDGTQRILTYSACGCAGGDVVTARDERGRQRRTTNDVLGRLARVEELNWDGTVYATANYSYTALDNLMTINHEGQIRSFSYDGYGRLQTRTTPEQGATTLSYFADDTVQTMTDARGATTTFGYNNRHLVTSITYNVSGDPTGQTAATPNVSFGYDAAGNRTSMTDGLGSVSYVYNQLSRMTSETRTFSGVGAFTLSYDYNLAGELISITNPWNVQVGYNYDVTGRPLSVSGANYMGVTSYVNGISYRAFGVKQMAYANGRSLSVGYDNRLRLSEWSIPGVMRRQFSYDWENSGRVQFVRDLDDETLDRFFAYDHVGRLFVSRSGTEARIANGEPVPIAYDGPYSQAYGYDVWGNRTHLEGWGGVGRWEDHTYTNNRRNGLQYDAAGNAIDGNWFTFSYDATGQQTRAVASGYVLDMSYDGDGLRAKKNDNGSVIYYLRSSVLRGQVVAELAGNGGWQRGYVYLGSQLLAIQAGGVYWTHQEPVTKSQRLTDVNGNVVTTVELDPFGGDTNRSQNQAMQPHRFTTYERDDLGADDAMFRRYNRWWGAFDQPDPYDGSYNLGDLQSFNRYAYVQNDPVNFMDPTGLMPICMFVESANTDFGTFNLFQCYNRPGMNDWYNGPREPVIRDNPNPNQRRGRSFLHDPNSDFCKSLLNKIKNIIEDIKKRRDEFTRNPQNLPTSVPGGRLRDDQVGHIKIIVDAYENLQRRIDEYTSRCGGPPPGIPPLSPVPGRGPSVQAPRPGFRITREQATAAAAGAGAAVVTYFVIRSILRVAFPPSNLVPVP